MAAAVTPPAPTAWDPPPAPDRDLWWHAQRIAAPDGADFTARHRRGHVVLPYDLGEHSGGFAGDRVEAWVCCDPQCGGVELGEAALETNHCCCPSPRYAASTGWAPRRRHMVGRGRLRFAGFYHGPFTDWWEPGEPGGVR